MSARPSSFKKGGGFLNNVDGVITDYVFTDEFNGEPFKASKDPKTKKERFHSLYMLISVRVDGADEDVSTTLFAGGAEDFNISEDGKAIWDSSYDTEEEALAAEAEKPGSTRTLGANTGVGIFVTSLVQAGFPEQSLPEDRINYESVIGTRCRFVQKKNEDVTRRLGKRKDPKNPGKEYDRTDLAVDTVYELPGATEPEPVAKPAKKVGVSAKAPAAPAVKPLGSGKGKAPVKAAPVADDYDLESATTGVLIDLITDAGGTLPKAKLSMAVLKKLMKDPHREDVRKRIFEDDFLAQDDAPWAYDKKKGVITMDVAA